MRRPQVRSILRKYGELEQLDPEECAEIYYEPSWAVRSCYIVWGPDEKANVTVAVLRGGEVIVDWDRQTTPDEFAKAIARDLKLAGYKVEEICTYGKYRCE